MSHKTFPMEPLLSSFFFRHSIQWYLFMKREMFTKTLCTWIRSFKRFWGNEIPVTEFCDRIF